MKADPYDSAEDGLTDLGGILHALDIIRFEDALNKPGSEFYALNVLIPLAVEKCEAAPNAMEHRGEGQGDRQYAAGVVPMITRLVALFEALTASDLEAARLTDLKRFALARHWANLADLARQARGSLSPK